MAADTSSKTEKPTARRLREARKDGQFPRSQDPATWLAIAVGAALVPHTVGVLRDEVTVMLAALPGVAADPTPERALAAIAAMAAQGVHLTTRTLKFKASRLSPKQGIKRMLGVRALWEAAKALVKVLVIAAVVTVLGRSLVPQLVGRGTRSLGDALGTLTSGLQSLVWTAAAAGLLMAAADYAYQRRTVMKQLRMTPREIKDENRQTEGDPMVKQHIRSKQVAMSRNRMLAAVATADVVVVNPTHYAVALAYEAGKGAPRVVAKGADALAARIRERAREHRVPIVEDKPLTRLLYRVCELDDEIPAELYVAVARILAFVLSLRRPGTPPVPRPAPAPLPALPSKIEMRVRRSRERRESRRGSRLLSAGPR